MHRSFILPVVTGLCTIAGAALAQPGPVLHPPQQVTITVHEGTSMAVSVSPDGKMLAMDLQGSIWVLPVGGGEARRVTDIFNDARQPQWSPDSKQIVFFGYRDGGYDIWEVGADGSNQHQLTEGTFDDREPIFSHDGTHIAFSSDRGDPLGSDNNIWTLDVRTGQLTELTTNPAEDTMPAWSPDDKEIVFISSRDNYKSAWAVNVATKVERKVASAPTGGRIDAASYGPGGQLVYESSVGFDSQLDLDGKPITKNEVAFPFRPSWVSANEFFYTADGKIKRRTLGGAVKVVPFSVNLEVTPAENTYARKKRDFNDQAPRPVLGIERPMLSPDGKEIAFVALGDLWLLPVTGGKPQNLTNDAAYDLDPTWSPDGRFLAWSSDRGGGLLEIWIRDMQTGQMRQLTHIPTQPTSLQFSPDGKRIAFVNVDAMWRGAGIAVADVATGQVTQIHKSFFAPGTPTWSPDGKRIALAMVAPYNRKYREGTNQVLTMSSTGTPDNPDEKWFAPQPNMSIDSRGWSGPVWSPDGTHMLAIYEGQLAIWPAAPLTGEPQGPVRHLTSEIAYNPSWAGDSRHVLYQANDKLRLMDLESGETRTVPLDFTYQVYVPKTHLVIHVGKLVDGVAKTARNDVDIVIDGNHITSVGPHVAGRADTVDAPDLTAMPGLIENHSHRQSDFGEQQGRTFLAYGITTVRNPGSLPYEAVEDREAGDAGIRVQPRIFDTGHLMEWKRTYYKMGTAISSNAHLMRELERGHILGFDLFKSYVRMPDIQQKMIVDFAHSIGEPVATHEDYPAAFDGMDSVEHTTATSRRGYSTKATFNYAYEDVIQIIGRSHMTWTPTVFGGMRDLLAAHPELKNDPRLAMDPPWLRDEIKNFNNVIGTFLPAKDTGTGKAVMDGMHAGARITAGTDEPEGMFLHAELFSYVQFGMTPYEALRTATVNSADLLDLDAGTIEPGKLADIILVQGNPLEDIENANNVRRVILNGRMFSEEDLVSGKAKDAPRQ